MELAFLLLLFFIVSLVQQAAEKRRRGGGRPPVRRPPVVSGEPVPGGRGAGEGPQSFRELLEEMRRAMEHAGEVERRPASTVPAPRPRYDARHGRTAMYDSTEYDESELEERESLEVEPTIVSLEGEVHRPARQRVDYDDEAELLLRQRAERAAQRELGRQPGDHRAFDERIRRSGPPSVVVKDRAAELRRMIEWREVLGKPLALRDDRQP